MDIWPAVIPIPYTRSLTRRSAKGFFVRSIFEQEHEQEQSEDSKARWLSKSIARWRSVVGQGILSRYTIRLIETRLNWPTLWYI